jgi:hypothetical protein
VLCGGRARVDIQFFFVPEERYEGVAAIIMRPASWATEIRRSWISCRLMSAMLCEVSCSGEKLGSEERDGGVKKKTSRSFQIAYQHVRGRRSVSKWTRSIESSGTHRFAENWI